LGLPLWRPSDPAILLILSSLKYSLRDILLPRLMTGMINVDHIELPITKQETEAA